MTQSERRYRAAAEKLESLVQELEKIVGRRVRALDAIDAQRENDAALAVRATKYVQGDFEAAIKKRRKEMLGN
jgi:hypothetical protein